MKKAANEIEAGGFDSYPNPVYYELLRLCGIGSRLMQNIKYNERPK